MRVRVSVLLYRIAVGVFWGGKTTPLLSLMDSCTPFDPYYSSLIRMYLLLKYV
jgi:hypothetical protein